MQNTLENVKEFVKVKFGVETEPTQDEFKRFKFGSMYDIGNVWFSEKLNMFVRQYAYLDKMTEDKILVEETYTVDYDLVNIVEC